MKIAKCPPHFRNYCHPKDLCVVAEWRVNGRGYLTQIVLVFVCMAGAMQTIFQETLSATDARQTDQAKPGDPTKCIGHHLSNLGNSDHHFREN